MKLLKEKFDLKKFLRRLIFDAFILTFGNGLYALTVELIIRPSGIVLGGMTGLSIMINKFTGIPVWVMTYGFNIALFILGTIVLGWHFAMTIAASTVLYPALLGIVETFKTSFPKVQEFLRENILDDYFLTAILAGVMLGIAVGVVVRTGASTGGSDVPPLVVNKLTGLPVGTGLLILDGTIISLQLFVSPDVDIKKTLYGLVMIVAYSYVVDVITVMGRGRVQLSVITDKTDEVRKSILTELGRGVTLLSATKGYTGEKGKMMVSIISNRQLIKAKKIILDTDPSAFMVITRVSEVDGNGFSFYKGDKKLDKAEIE